MAYFGGTNAEKAWSKVEPRTIFLVAWLAICAAALFMVFQSGHIGGDKAPEPVAKVVTSSRAAILIPKENIVAGRKLSPDLFTIEVSDVAGLENKVLTSFEEIEGAYATTGVSAKSPMLRDYLTKEAPANVVTSQIPDGYRAVTVSVDAESGVEGWVRPGARVDVVWTSSVKGKAMVNTIIENAEVLSAERSTDISPQAGKPMPSHVTLLVSANDAQRLHLAKNTGSLSLTLRGVTDQSQKGSETVTVERLMKTGENEKPKTAGWVKVGEQTFAMTTSGELSKSEDQGKAMTKSGIFGK